MKKLSPKFIKTLAGSALAAVTLFSGFASAAEYTVTINHQVTDASGGVVTDAFALGGYTLNTSSSGAGGGGEGGEECYPGEKPLQWICPITAAVKTSKSVVDLPLSISISEPEAAVCGDRFEESIQVYNRDLGGDIQISYTYTISGDAPEYSDVTGRAQ